MPGADCATLQATLLAATENLTAATEAVFEAQTAIDAAEQGEASTSPPATEEDESTAGSTVIYGAAGGGAGLLLVAVLVVLALLCCLARACATGGRARVVSQEALSTKRHRNPSCDLEAQVARAGGGRM